MWCMSGTGFKLTDRKTVLLSIGKGPTSRGCHDCGNINDSGRSTALLLTFESAGSSLHGRDSDAPRGVRVLEFGCASA